MKLLSSYISSDVNIEGKIFSKGSARIDGKCQGIIESEDEITIGAFANIEGKINAKSIVVNGEIKGELTATEKVSILSNGDFEGNLHTPVGGIAVNKGGKFEGTFYTVDTPQSPVPKTTIVPDGNSEEQKAKEITTKSHPAPSANKEKNETEAQPSEGKGTNISTNGSRNPKVTNKGIRRKKRN